MQGTGWYQVGTAAASCTYSTFSYRLTLLDMFRHMCALATLLQEASVDIIDPSERLACMLHGHARCLLTAAVIRMLHCRSEALFPLQAYGGPAVCSRAEDLGWLL